MPGDKREGSGQKGIGGEKAGWAIKFSQKPSKNAIPIEHMGIYPSLNKAIIIFCIIIQKIDSIDISADGSKIKLKAS